MLTTREVFDTVKTHLLKQNERSCMNGTCAYRGSGGLKCAIGVLIKDSCFVTGLNSASVNTKSVKIMLENSDIDYDRNIYMLGRLQHIHDTIHPKLWPIALQRLETELINLGELKYNERKETMNAN